MSERKSFLVRLDPSLHAALQRWAADDLRSLNGQIEFILRRALQVSGRDRTSQSGVQDTIPGIPSRD
jgi:hypothetical protein